MHHIFVYGALRRYYLDTCFGKKGKNRFLYVIRTWDSWPLLGLEPSGNVIDSTKRDSVISVWWQNNASWQDGSTTTRYISAKNVCLSSFWLVCIFFSKQRKHIRESAADNIISHHDFLMVTCIVLTEGGERREEVHYSLKKQQQSLPTSHLMKKPWFFEKPWKNPCCNLHSHGVQVQG